MDAIGVIGGSGLYEIDGINNVEYIEVDTPWGKPSNRLVKGKIGDKTLLFLARHGKGHKISPSEINFRANIYAFKNLGIQRIISISAVGSMKEKIEPGHIVIPHQFIDNTKHRCSTFFDDGIVAHISMANPVCLELADCLYNASITSGAEVHKGGTYICIEGPQFSSKAESELYRSWNVDVIGMTNMPEAKLAAEAEICYSTLALSTDYDCWYEGYEDVTVGDVIKILNRNIELAKKILKEVIKIIPSERKCGCKESLKNSIITSKESINEETKRKYNLFIERYIK